MNKLGKIGVSALCGSLAGISGANAGDLTATGSAALTWMSQGGTVTGNPIGMASAVGFTGTGELDNGWGVKLSIALADGGGYSNTYVNITLPGVGDLRIDQGVSGTGIQRLDDITPTVWEEADGAGLSATINKVSGVSAGTNLELTPSDMVPAGLVARFAYSMDADSGQANDKVKGGDSGPLASGWDLTLEATSDLHGVDGLKIFGGISEVDQYTSDDAISGDKEEMVLGITYAAGNFSAGYQITEEDTGQTGVTGYDNTSYSVTFSVNDDLSLGYNFTESDGKGSTADPEAQSFQAAYTMGGATFSIAEVDVDNAGYTAVSTTDATIISLGLAF
jgi:outer membrane protein OmpU